MSKKPTNQMFERIFGQRICVHVAQACMGQIEQKPVAIGADLSSKATLSRIIDACRDVYQEIENEAAQQAMKEVK